MIPIDYIEGQLQELENLVREVSKKSIVEKFGTPEGLVRAWDTRGRGRAEEPSSGTPSSELLSPANARSAEVFSRMDRDLENEIAPSQSYKNLVGKTSDRVSAIRNNALKEAKRAVPYLAGDTNLLLRDHIDIITDLIKDPAFADVDAVDMDEMVRDSIDKLVYQEIISNRNQFTDHGIRHIVGDVVRQQDISTAMNKGIPLDPRERLAAVIILANHDMGYTSTEMMEGGQKAIDASKDHPARSKELFDSQRSAYSRIFTSDELDKMSEAIRTHDSPVLDKDDILTTSVRLADNLSMFSSEKLPGMFSYVPHGKEILMEMGKASKDKNLPKLEEFRKRLWDQIDGSNLSTNLKRDLKAGTKEISALTAKFTLGALAGNIDDIYHDDDTDETNITIKYNDLDVTLQTLFDMGQKQTNNLLTNYGHTDFSKTEYDLGGIVRLKVVGYHKIEKSGTSEGAILGWNTRGRGRKTEERNNEVSPGKPSLVKWNNLLNPLYPDHNMIPKHEFLVSYKFDDIVIRIPSKESKQTEFNDERVIQTPYETKTPGKELAIQIHKEYQKMPVELRTTISSINVSDYPSPYEEDDGGVTNATTSYNADTHKSDIFFYNNKIKTDILYHEAAHGVDGPVRGRHSNTFGISDSDEWQTAMIEDTGTCVSSYSNRFYPDDISTMFKEDFADSVRYYFRDKESFKKKYPRRTKIINDHISDGPSYISEGTRSIMDALRKDAASWAEWDAEHPPIPKFVAPSLKTYSPKLLKNVMVKTRNMTLDEGADFYADAKGNINIVFNKDLDDVKYFEKAVRNFKEKGDGEFTVANKNASDNLEKFNKFNSDHEMGHLKMVLYRNIPYLDEFGVPITDQKEKAEKMRRDLQIDPDHLVWLANGDLEWKDLCRDQAKTGTMISPYSEHNFAEAFAEYHCAFMNNIPIPAPIREYIEKVNKVLEEEERK
jgi:hypothetical protein